MHPCPVVFSWQLGVSLSSAGKRRIINDLDILVLNEAEDFIFKPPTRVSQSFYLRLNRCVKLWLSLSQDSVYTQKVIIINRAYKCFSVGSPKKSVRENFPSYSTGTLYVYVLYTVYCPVGFGFYICFFLTCQGSFSLKTVLLRSIPDMYRNVKSSSHSWSTDRRHPAIHTPPAQV